GGGRLFVVDGHADQFRAGAGEGGDLLYGRGDIGGIRVGVGLHHNWGIAGYADTAAARRNCLFSLGLSPWSSTFSCCFWTIQTGKAKPTTEANGATLSFLSVSVVNVELLRIQKYRC